MRTGLRRQRSFAGQITRSGIALVAFLIAALGSSPLTNRAEAYLLINGGDIPDLIVGSDSALRWAASAWAPGATLRWQLEDGPSWGQLPGIGSRQDFVPFVERALAAWAGVETADISWQLDTAGPPPLPRGSARANDGQNQIWFDPADVLAVPGAALWWTRNSAREAWEITECDLLIPADWGDDGVSAGNLPSVAAGFLVRELGSCLGLAPAATVPGSFRIRLAPAGEVAERPEGSWWPPPAMSASPDSATLAEDDRVGASLLRPRSGWQSGTGGISGRLELDGGPVRYGHVYAMRSGANGFGGDAVGAFSNASGAFSIEGLPPGEYVLWAHPIRDYTAHMPLITDGADTVWRDGVVGQLVSVRAGQVSTVPTIAVREGRE